MKRRNSFLTEQLKTGEAGEQVKPALAYRGGGETLAVTFRVQVAFSAPRQERP